MKTEAEILQIYKDYSTDKNLSVSEKTMQKRAAKLAELSIEDETLFDSLVNTDLEFFEVVNDNIRHERSVQKRKTEEEMAPRKETSSTKESEESTQGEDLESRLMGVIDELKGEIDSFKNKELINEKRQTIEKKLFSKGVDKKDKELVNELISLQSISGETDVDSVSDTIVNIYNKIKVSPKNIDTPRKPEGEELDKMIEAAISEIGKYDY